MKPSTALSGTAASTRTRPIRIAYDLSYLATFFAQPDCKTGIFRVIEEVLFELDKMPEVEITGVPLCGRLQKPTEPMADAIATFLYLEERQDTLRCKFDPSVKNRLGMSKLSWDAFTHPSLKHELRQILHPEFAAKPRIARQTSVRALSMRLLRSVLYRLNYVYGIDEFRRYFNRDKFDVFHSGFFRLPPKTLLGDIPRVITVYDLIPLLAPQFIPDKRFISMFRDIFTSIDIECDWIACISEYTRQEFCEYTGMSPDRVFVTSLAAADHFYPVEDMTLRQVTLQKYGLADGEYFLTLAAPQPRKNLTHLIRCFYNLSAEYSNLSAKLVLVGSSKQSSIEAELATAIASSPEFSSRIVFTDYVPDEDLGAIYSGAMAFVFPSLYEGFGLPVLEAMQCGTPVISSNATSLPEVAGDAAILVNPRDADELSQAMLDIFLSASLRAKCRENGLSRARQFSWRKCADDVVEIYRNATGLR